MWDGTDRDNKCVGCRRLSRAGALTPLPPSLLAYRPLQPLPHFGTFSRPRRISYTRFQCGLVLNCHRPSERSHSSEFDVHMCRHTPIADLAFIRDLERGRPDFECRASGARESSLLARLVECRQHPRVRIHRRYLMRMGCEIRHCPSGHPDSTVSLPNWVSASFHDRSFGWATDLDMRCGEWAIDAVRFTRLRRRNLHSKREIACDMQQWTRGSGGPGPSALAGC